jgi:hypothetical protein
MVERGVMTEGSSDYDFLGRSAEKAVLMRQMRTVTSCAA